MGNCSPRPNRIIAAAIFSLLFVFVFSCKDSQVEKGYACLVLGDYRLAEKLFRAHLEQYPQSYDARLGLGKALLQKYVDKGGDANIWDNAIKQFQACKTIRPKADLGKLISDAFLDRSRRLLVLGDTLEASVFIAQALEYDTNNIESLILAGIMAYSEGYSDKALIMFQKALVADSANPAIHYNLGILYWEKGDYEMARDYWLMVLEADPEDEAVIEWFERADQKLKERTYQSDNKNRKGQSGK